MYNLRIWLRVAGSRATVSIVCGESRGCNQLSPSPMIQTATLVKTHARLIDHSLIVFDILRSPFRDRPPVGRA
jgi:hypothetical protein